MSRPVGKLCGILLALGGSLGFAQQYTLTTAAGGAPPPTPVAAASTSIGQPNRVAVDTKGNVYFSSNHTVFKIDGSGNLTVAAGNSRAGFSGDGGPAAQAQLNTPQGLSLDGAGNLYIADSRNNRVRVVNAQGVISTFAGTGAISAGGAGTFGDGGLAINGLLALPSGVFAANSGNVFIADTNDNIVREVTPDGIIHTVAGNGFGSFSGDTSPAVAAELHSPTDVFADSKGNIYIADSANDAIRQVNSSGVINTVAGDPKQGLGHTGDGGLAISAALTAPYAVSLDSAGNMYVAENGDSVVRKVDAKGNISTIVGMEVAAFSGDGGPALKAALNFPTGLCVDSNGNLYIADTLNRRIRKVAGGNISTFAGNGVLSYSGDGGPATSAQFNTPEAVAVDSAGNFYVADTFNHVVRRVTAGGAITTIAGNGTAGFGGDGGSATAAQLNGPIGIAVDSTGNVYVSDSQNARVRKISGGTINTVAGTGTAGFGGDNGPATAAQLNIPAGLAVDSTGNLYIADFINNRVRKVSGGTMTTVAGSGLSGYAGDNGPALAARLTTPSSVAVDNQGNLYIADLGNNAVRKVSGGTITTVAGTGLPGESGDGGAATAAAVGSPYGVAVDTSGNVYIADGSSLVRKVYTTGIITTIAGNGTQGYSGDGGSAPFGELNGPTSLSVASNGNVYVADSSNNAVRLLINGGFSVNISAAVNAASNLVGAVAPGDVVVFYGTGLAPAGLMVNHPNALGVYGTSLNGVTVHFGNYLAPLLYVSATQVAAVVPFEVSGPTVQAFISSQGQFSAGFPVVVAQASPGIFTADLSGTGQAAAINFSTGAYNNAANPINQGDFIELYLTGTGPTSPAGVDGKPYSAIAPCAITPVKVTIGGLTAALQYCGGVVGQIPGLTQINALVPGGLTAGAAPVTVAIGNVAAQSGVTIAVSGH